MKHEQLFQRLNELSVKQLEFQRRVSEIAQPTLTQPKVAYPRNTQLKGEVTDKKQGVVTHPLS